MQKTFPLNRQKMTIGQKVFAQMEARRNRLLHKNVYSYNSTLRVAGFARVDSDVKLLYKFVFDTKATSKTARTKYKKAHTSKTR